MNLFSSEQCLKGRAKPIDGENWFHRLIRNTTNAYGKLMDNVLCLACIGWSHTQQAPHQIDQPTEHSQKRKSHDTGWDRNPDRGDCRPASYIPRAIGGCNDYKYNESKEKNRSQDDRQKDLAGSLFAMSSIRFMDRFGEYGFHRLYFSILATQGDWGKCLMEGRD